MLIFRLIAAADIAVIYRFAAIRRHTMLPPPPRLPRRRYDVAALLPLRLHAKRLHYAIRHATLILLPFAIATPIR